VWRKVLLFSRTVIENYKHQVISYRSVLIGMIFLGICTICRLLLKCDFIIHLPLYAYLEAIDYYKWINNHPNLAFLEKYFEPGWRRRWWKKREKNIIRFIIRRHFTSPNILMVKWLYRMTWSEHATRMALTSSTSAVKRISQALRCLEWH
jgi:hypothetical protein